MQPVAAPVAEVRSAVDAAASTPRRALASGVAVANASRVSVAARPDGMSLALSSGAVSGSDAPPPLAGARGATDLRVASMRAAALSSAIVYGCLG